jgi:hypothetical protein
MLSLSLVLVLDDVVIDDVPEPRFKLNLVKRPLTIVV